MVYANAYYKKAVRKGFCPATEGEAVGETSTTTDGAATAFRLYQPRLARPADLPRPVAVADWRGGVVVRATNWLGDTFLALPAIYRLKCLLPPGAGLFVLCSDKLAPIWRCLPWVDRVIPFPGSRADQAARAEIRRLNPGAALIVPNSFGAAWDLFGLAIPVRVGRAGRLRSLLLTDRLPPLPPPAERRDRHQLSEYLELVSRFGGAENPGSLGHGVTESSAAAEISWVPAPVTAGDFAAVAGKLGLPDDRPLLALAPGAAYGPAKQWPATHFREVARWWTDRGGRVLVVGSPKEAAVGDEVLSGMAGGVNAAGRTSLPEMLALLGGCRALVSNDSGAMHLAAAAGVSGVALFGSTSAVATGPLGGRWVVLEEKMECSPCFQRNCRFTGTACRCLQAIPAARVCAAMEWLAAGKS